MSFGLRRFLFGVAALLGAVMLFANAAQAETVWPLDARWHARIKNPNSSSLIVFLEKGGWPPRYDRPPTLTIEHMNCFNQRAVPEDVLRTTDEEMDRALRAGIHDMTVIALVKIFDWCRR